MSTIVYVEKLPRESVLEEELTPTTSSSSNQSISPTLPFQTTSDFLFDTHADVDPNMNLSISTTTVVSSPSSSIIHFDHTSSSTTNLNIISPPASYLIAQAQVNGICSVVLLDTGDKSTPLLPYDGPDIQGPEGLTYPISSDLSNVGRIDVPLLSTQSRTIPPYHVAFIQVKTPSFISSDTWEASVTGIRRYAVAANALVRIENQCCLLQIINCSSKNQFIFPGQRLAVADLYDDDIHDVTASTTPQFTSSSFNNIDTLHEFNCTIEPNKFNTNDNNSCSIITCQESQNNSHLMSPLCCDNSIKTFASIIDDSNPRIIFCLIFPLLQFIYFIPKLLLLIQHLNMIKNRHQLTHLIIQFKII
jgi:hypothetical protein